MRNFNTNKDRKEIYENIMSSVSKELKSVLNEYEDPFAVEPVAGSYGDAAARNIYKLLYGNNVNKEETLKYLKKTILNDDKGNSNLKHFIQTLHDLLVSGDVMLG